MPLSSLPLDILLAVLRDLDIVDVVRIGMACKDLHEATQDRHVWIDQLEKLCQDVPMLRSATPPLPSLSAQELKTFVTGRVKLRLRWNKDAKENDFAAMGLVEVPGVEDLRLLPGGKSMLIMSHCEGATLRRVKFEDGRVSLPVVAKFPRSLSTFWRWQLLTAMSPCPILAQREEDDIHLVRVDHHNGAMNLETTFTIPEGYGPFAEAHGHGRVVGFLIERLPSQESLQAIVINLDYPGVSMKCEVPAIYDPDFDPSRICVPTERILIVYNIKHILVYDIPDFSSLSLGINPPGVAPAWHWPGPDEAYESVGFRSPYMTGGALYDPRSTQGFDLHFVCGYEHSTWEEPSVTTVTVPINLRDSFAASELPPLKQKLSPLAHADTWRRPIWFSCQGALHFDVFLWEDPRLEVLVTPLKDLGLKGGKKTLRMIVSFAELEGCTKTIKADMDEATGRVVIWGWDRQTYQRKIFVGDLV